MENLVSSILDNLNSEFSEISTLNFNNLKRILNEDLKSPLEILNIIENEPDNGNLYKIKAKEHVHKIINKLYNENTLDSHFHKLYWEISTKIVTTNYDQIIENNKPDDREIEIFSNENEFQTLKAQKDDAKFLYKIHGDFKNPETIILFESDYKSIYSNNNANNNALGDFFKNKTFLFLGFSLSDPFINELFTKIKSLYNNYTLGNHFLISTSSPSDFSKFDVKHIRINDYTESLKNFLELLIKEKKSLEEKLEIVKDEHIKNENLDSLFVLVKSKMDDLIKDPNNKTLSSEIHDIQTKINELIYGPLNVLKTFNSEYKNTHLQMLFDNIYGNDKLSQETIDDINRIRSDYDNHKWFERCQLVSALTCSLFIFNKANEKKISILVDFINDGEDKVWERSLTYLIMILNHLGNKWLRFDTIKKKVNTLAFNNRVQNACQIIVEYILVVGIDNYTFSSNVFENEYFKENPYNYFLPFFKENNPLFENIYENFKDEENIEDFIEFLENVPFPDSLKYIMCNTASVKRNSTQSNDNKMIMYSHLEINGGYYPYAGFIQEFVSFIKNFPSLQNQKLIDTQLKITSTPLKDYLLNEKERFRILGIHFFKEAQWGQAIINFEKYTKLDDNDMVVLDNLVSCYLNNNEIEKAQDLSINIYTRHPKNIYNLLRLADIYHSESKFVESLNLLDEYIKIDDANPEVHFKRAVTLLALSNFDDALISNEKAEELEFEDKASLYEVYGIIFKNLKDFNVAFDYYNKAIEIDTKNPELYSARSELYEDAGDYDKAIADINRAIGLDSDESYLFTKIYYLLQTNKLNEVYSILLNIKNKEDQEYYNTLTNYYRLKGEFDLAFSTIEKAIQITDKKNRLIGTKAAIYATMGDDINFFKYLNQILAAGEKASRFLPDIKNKYRDNDEFLRILKKYNQEI